MHSSASFWLATVALGMATSVAERADAQDAAPSAVASALRYTMSDGSSIIGVPTAEDATTLTIETAVGTIRVFKANIAAVQPIGAAGVPPTETPATPSAPAAAPPPPPAPPETAPLPLPAPPAVAAPVAPYGRNPWLQPLAPPPAPRTPSRKLIIWGAILFGGAYTLAALMSTSAYASSTSGAGLLPVIGALILATDPRLDASAPALVVDALVQAAGLAMLIAGIAKVSRTRPGGPSTPRVALGPLLNARGAGLVVAGRF